jgi:hypothetical protein
LYLYLPVSSTLHIFSYTECRHQVERWLHLFLNSFYFISFCFVLYLPVSSALHIFSYTECRHQVERWLHLLHVFNEIIAITCYGREW